MIFLDSLNDILVAVCNTGVRSTDHYVNVPLDHVLAMLHEPVIGEKDGGHFLRSELKVTYSGHCLPRSNVNTQSLARLLIIDCDKSCDGNGIIDRENAPNPYVIHDIAYSTPNRSTIPV